MLRAFGTLLLAVGLVTTAGANVPDLAWLECSTATSGPLSVFCSPDGNGDPLNQAWAPGGAPADATLTMRLFVWGNQGPEPVADFPREDIWLEGGATWFRCLGGTLPYADTDADGETFWRDPLAVGGYLDAGAGDVLTVMVNGVAFDGSAVTNLSFNSADLNGDLAVDLLDVVVFSMDYFAGGSYRTDFVWNGRTDLSDVVKLAGALGKNCPQGAAAR